MGYDCPMSADLLPDVLPMLRCGETISARLTPEQLDRAIREAESRYGLRFKVEPARHYWLTVEAIDP